MPKLRAKLHAKITAVDTSDKLNNVHFTFELAEDGFKETSFIDRMSVAHALYLYEREGRLPAPPAEDAYAQMIGTVYGEYETSCDWKSLVGLEFESERDDD